MTLTDSCIRQPNQTGELVSPKAAVKRGSSAAAKPQKAVHENAAFQKHDELVFDKLGSTRPCLRFNLIQETLRVCTSACRAQHRPLPVC